MINKMFQDIEVLIIWKKNNNNNSQTFIIISKVQQEEEKFNLINLARERERLMIDAQFVT